MRMIGFVLALGAIVWVTLQLAGGSDAETVVPEAHQQALKKASNLEQSLQQDLQDSLQAIEERE